MTVFCAIALAITIPLGQIPAGEKKPPSGRIAGRVVAADTGKPIRYATVRILSFNVKGVNRATRTDAQGRFEYAGLETGEYWLSAEAERYLEVDFGGRPTDGRTTLSRPIRIKDGENFTKAEFSLPRGAAIEGSLLDEFGDPAPGLMVRVAQVVYAGGRRRLMPIGGPGQARTTDDKGRFRVYGLAPGTYYVSALSGAFAAQAETGGFAPTYYPGTADLMTAKPVRLDTGQELDLTFPLVPARMARLSGRVVNATGEPVARATLTLSTSDRLGLSDFNITRGVTEPDGTFVFHNVPPGSFALQGYGAQVSSAGNLGASEFGWLPMVVDGNDQADLVLRVAQGPSLKGRVSLDDPSTAFNARAAGVLVTAVPVEFDSAPVGGGPPPYTIADDGVFEVKNMSGRRIIRVSVQNPGWMLKRITRQSRDITDEPMDFSKGEIAEIEVVLTNRVTSITGAVADAEGNRVTDYSVVFFATDPAKWTVRSRFIALGRPSQDGSFIVRGLPPDEYFAVALRSTQGTEWQDPEWLNAIQEPAARFFLGDGEQKTLALRLSERR
jgi:hypothetical protein